MSSSDTKLSIQEETMLENYDKTLDRKLFEADTIKGRVYLLNKEIERLKQLFLKKKDSKRTFYLKLQYIVLDSNLKEGIESKLKLKANTMVLSDKSFSNIRLGTLRTNIGRQLKLTKDDKNRLTEIFWNIRNNPSTPPRSDDQKIPAQTCAHNCLSYPLQAWA